MEWKSVKAVSDRAEANAGNRRTMEDAHCCIDNYANVPGQGMFAVFDGHGGTGIVKYLEKNFSEILERHMNKDKKASVIEAITNAYAECDMKSAAEGINSSGSTAACCIIRKEGEQRVLYTANVGDTRAVLCRGNNTPQRLTYDHTALDESEVARIEKAGGFILRKRVLGILSVARAIGDHSMKKYIISKPYTSVVSLQPTDTFVIIACDGVWDVFSDEEAVKFVAEVIEQGTTPMDKTADKLVQEAMNRGSQDNITAIIIHL